MKFLENILTFSTINIHHSWKSNDSINFFLFFAFQPSFNHPHNSLSFSNLTILLHSPHNFFQFFLRKTVIFHFIVIFISIKQYIIMMTIFFILYFITIYLLIAVYPFFIKGMVQLVNDLSRIAQIIILFIVTSICIIVKKWRKRNNNG